MILLKKSINLIVSIAFSLGLISCNKAMMNPGPKKPAKSEDIKPVKPIITGHGSFDKNPLNQQETGPAPRLVDAKFLEARFRRIFDSENPRNVKPCTGCENRELLANSNQFFMGHEQKILGSFSLREKATCLQRNDSGECQSDLLLNLKQDQNAVWLKNLNQPYLKTLRNALGGACRKLVEMESNQIEPTNKLIRQSMANEGLNIGPPTADDISHFMTLMFGYLPNINKKHSGAEEYSQLINENVSRFIAANQPEDEVLFSFLQENFHYLCIAIGQDPRVFVR